MSSSITSVPRWSKTSVAALNAAFQANSAGQTSQTWVSIASNIGVDLPDDAAAVARIRGWAPGSLITLASRYSRDSGGRTGTEWAAIATVAQINDTNTVATFGAIASWSTGALIGLSSAFAQDRGILSAAQWAKLATTLGADETDAVAAFARLSSWAPATVQSLADSFAKDNLGYTAFQWAEVAAKTGPPVSAVQAALKGGVNPPPGPPELDSLEVAGAEKTDDGLYYQFYAPGQTVRIRAVTTPDTPDAHARIAWTGGEPDFSGAPNLRAISLGTLTAVGKPATVTAALGDTHLSVQVAVVPSVVGFDVSDAVSDGDATWGLSAETGATATVRAMVVPDTQEAFAFLQWSGGAPDPSGAKNKRVVSHDAFTDPSKPLPVEVTIVFS